MDWTNFAQIASQAAVVVAITGVIGSAATQLIKQVVGLAGTKMSGQWAATISGLVSCALAAYILYAQGIPIAMAIAGALVAIYAPQPVHDVVKRLQPGRGSNGGDSLYDRKI